MADQAMSSIGCCGLCLETFQDPRILPSCGHTFCRNCIIQYGKNEKLELDCPMCRTKTRIPASGLEELPKNYSLCDMLQSSFFSVIEEPPRVPPAEVIKSEGCFCTKHTENELQLYCLKCSETICVECIDTGHTSHKVFTINKVAADARIQMQSDMEKVKKKLSMTRQARDKIEATNIRLLRLFAKTELDIKKEYEQIKSYLEEQKNTLDLELITLKTNLMKQLEIEKQDVEAQELSLTSFTTHINEMMGKKEKRASLKVVESLTDLNSRSKGLLQMKVKELGTCSTTDVSFKPTNFLKRSFFGNKQHNLIGKVEVKIYSSSDDSNRQFLQPKFGAASTVRSSVQDACVLDDPSTKKKTSYVTRKKAAWNDDNNREDDDNRCVMCLENITDKMELPCKHKFCRKCMDDYYYFSKCQPRCPSCGKVFKSLRGNQPEGTMSIKENNGQHLAGYSGCGTFEIEYYFGDGVQGENHPNPGQSYRGTHRTAYLPGNKEGRDVLRLLKRAFDSGLVFTIGLNNTTGQDNVVIVNKIPHKTSPSGLYGYPDPTYLKRVKEELAAKGIQ